MLGRIRTPIGAIVLGLMVFGTVFATAASLNVNSADLPLSGSDSTLVCDSDGVNVGYTIIGNDVTAIVVSDDDCTTGTATLSTAALYTFNGGPTQPNSTSITFRLTSPVPVGAFDPQTVTVTIIP